MIGRRPNPKGVSPGKVRRVSSGRLITPIIESVHIPARITLYPTGRLFEVALSQALRARLRSDRPSGTGGTIFFGRRPTRGSNLKIPLFPPCPYPPCDSLSSPASPLASDHLLRLLWRFGADLEEEDAMDLSNRFRAFHGAVISRDNDFGLG
jgi:hypothetical protein